MNKDICKRCCNESASQPVVLAEELGPNRTRIWSKADEKGWDVGLVICSYYFAFVDVKKGEFPNECPYVVEHLLLGGTSESA